MRSIIQRGPRFQIIGIPVGREGTDADGLRRQRGSRLGIAEVAIVGSGIVAGQTALTQHVGNQFRIDALQQSDQFGAFVGRGILQLGVNQLLIRRAESQAVPRFFLRGDRQRSLGLVIVRFGGGCRGRCPRATSLLTRVGRKER